MGEHVVARTTSRRTLGVINEFVHLAERYRDGRDVVNLTQLSLWLAQVPCSPLSDRHGMPDRELQALLG